MTSIAGGSATRNVTPGSPDPLLMASGTAALPNEKVSLIGGGPSMPVNRSFRYRITWQVVVAGVLPNALIKTRSMANDVQKSLASVGLMPVSNIEAMDGDGFIQFTCQLLTTFPGYTLADVVSYANRLPLLTASGMLRAALEVSEVEVRASGLSSEIVRAQDQVSRQRAKAIADKREITNTVKDAAVNIGQNIKENAQSLDAEVRDAIGKGTKGFSDTLDKFFGGVSDLVKLAIVGAVVVGVVFVYTKNRA